MRKLHVYILASISRVLYIGVTNDLQRRLHEHRTARFGFTAAYHVHRLVYFETIGPPIAAIRREKQLKRLTRKKKLALIRSVNPTWADLSKGWLDPPPCHPEPPP
jgi:putative endonuclease